MSSHLRDATTASRIRARPISDFDSADVNGPPTLSNMLVRLGVLLVVAFGFGPPVLGTALEGQQRVESGCSTAGQAGYQSEPPSPAGLFARLGVLILVALCFGLAAQLLVGGL